MLVNQELQKQLSDLVQGARAVLVAVVTGSEDALAAAIGFGEVLGRENKTVTIAYSNEPSPKVSSLPGHERIVSSLSKNFVITLKEAVGNVEKVSYYTEGNDLCLVIHPKTSATAFTSDKIAYSDSSAGFDLIFIVGAANLIDLGSVYDEEPSLYSNNRIINVDIHQDNSRFGEVNLVNPQASSVSEEMVGLVQTLGLTLSEEAATAFLFGIEEATRNFSSPQASPEAFDKAALCLRAGGQRLAAASVAQVRPRPSLPKTKPQEVKVQSSPATSAAPPVQPLSPTDDSQKVKSVSERPEEDWLQPKIYKGGQLL